MNTLQIRTPEGVVFTQILASPILRFAAWFIDAVIILSLSLGVQSLLISLAIISLDIAQAFAVLAYFAISIGYGMLCEWLWRGQTFGKKLLRLRVVDAEGLRLQFNQIAVRNLLRFVDVLLLCYLVGGVTSWLNRRQQRLGDIAANTIVIRQPKIQQPDLDQLLTDKYNSLRQYPHLEARLRQRVSPAEASLALRALLRRNDFEPEARLRLFADFAGHFREKVSFPAEALDGVSDERFLRNVVDILYRTRATTPRETSAQPESVETI